MSKSTPIDLGLLRCFLALMDHGSVSQAAIALDVSQPTMSAALARLRLVFNDPLLVRTGSGMTPTPRALTLQDEVRDIVARIDTLVAPHTAFDPSVSQASFVITMPDYMENTLMPHLIHRLHREAPYVRIEVVPSNPEKANEWLANGEVDFRMGWVRDPQPSSHGMPLFEDHFVCAVSAQHPTIKGTLTLEDYTRFPHILTRTSQQSNFWRRVVEAHANLPERPRIAHVMQDFMATPRIVAQTSLIATMPYRLARKFEQSHALQILPPPIELPRIVLRAYWHSRTQNSATHTWFRTVLRETAEALRLEDPA